MRRRHGDTFLALLRRDIARFMPGGQRGGGVLPLLFFLAVAMLYPFAVGPDGVLLARTGGGVIWIAALLAAILPIDRLVEPDIDQGFFDQWAMRGIAEEAVLGVRVVAHWLSFGPPLMLAALPASALVGIDGATLRLVELGLLAGTPGLAALGVTVAASACLGDSRCASRRTKEPQSLLDCGPGTRSWVP